MITTEEILTSFSPERRRRIEEGAEALIDELGLDKISKTEKGDSLIEPQFEGMSEPRNATSVVSV